MGLNDQKYLKAKQPLVSQMLTTMKAMCEAHEVDDLLKKLQDGAIILVCRSFECRAAIFKFNSKDGSLKPIAMNTENWQGDKYLNEKINYGEGIVGQSIKKRTSIKVDDYSNSEYSKHHHKSLWENSVSEISVPIIAKNLPSIFGVNNGINSDKCGEKLIGVINIESQNHHFFTEDDKQILEQLTDYAAILIEKIERSHKISEIRELENKLARSRKKTGINYNKIINELIATIGNIFRFDFINISLVDQSPKSNLTSKIRSKYIFGLDKEKKEKFMSMAVHNLDSDDIQSDIARKGLIEVPERKDSRFDNDIYQQFGHENLVRVFMPIFEPSSNDVFGTLEAGYDSDFCPYIFEDDVRILTGLVWHIASLIEQQRSSFVEMIIHELSSPLSAIRGHASYVQRKVSTFNNNRIALKMSDILHESEMIGSQIDKLTYLFQGQAGQISNELEIQDVNLFTDVIARITFQRKPDLIRLGLPSNIRYDISDRLKRKSVKTDSSKLGQIIHNLMDNSIKYRNKSDPESFSINVAMEQDLKFIYIYFQDWGIGIKEEFKKRIFEEGFRDPDVIRWELGSGLGLAISKAIMLQLGGDLEVSKLKQPTEFKLTLPKNFQDTRVE